MQSIRSVVGVVGSLPIDPVEYCILAAGTAIAWAVCFELTVLTFYTFRRWSGLYFYSLLISSWGCTFHALGFILKFLTHTPPAGFLPFIEIGELPDGLYSLRMVDLSYVLTFTRDEKHQGLHSTGWVAMVTGQSFVLYSRLHLVVRKQQTLRLVLTMIIVDGILLHTPTIVLTIGSNTSNGQHWVPTFNVMERIQLAIFCIQEFIISTIYIVFTIRLLGSIYHSRTRAVMIQLVIINSICLSMDVILIGLEYSNHYVGETSVKAMIYSIKLKLEFTVLNEFLNLAQAGLTEHGRRRGSSTIRNNARTRGHRILEREDDVDVHLQDLDNQSPALPKKSCPDWMTMPLAHTKSSSVAKREGCAGIRTDCIERTQTIDVISEPRNMVVQGKSKPTAETQQW